MKWSKLQQREIKFTPNLCMIMTILYLKSRLILLTFFIKIDHFTLNRIFPLSMKWSKLQQKGIEFIPNLCMIMTILYLKSRLIILPFFVKIDHFTLNRNFSSINETVSKTKKKVHSFIPKFLHRIGSR